MAALILLVLFLALLPIYHFLAKGTRGSNKRLPPGSMGIPIIGQSLSLLRAMRANRAEEWLEHRINKYGPVSRLSLFGAPTVLLTGPAANKFIFYSEALALKQPQSITRILGKRSILELIGEDHKRVRGALGKFLKPEVLKGFVDKIDGEVRQHLKLNWIGRQNVTVSPLMKRLTFDVISSIIFGLERGPLREGILNEFMDMIEGILAVPLNLPFTSFNKSLKASRRARKVLLGITQEKKVALEQGRCHPHDDLITCLLSMAGDSEVPALTDEEIVDNAMVVLVAGYDTTSILMTFMIRHLADDPITLARIVQEQEEIANNKAPGEALTWDDLIRMKYTWWVAMEMLRMIPPVFGSFRRVLKDVEFEGYLIPKGWQVFWAMNITYMDERIFHEPSKFDPTRFESQSSIPPYSFVAFGGGKRICPGFEFARMETLVTMHYLVTNFKWRLCGKDNGFSRNPTPSPSHGLPIQLEPKE